MSFSPLFPKKISLIVLLLGVALVAFAFLADQIRAGGAEGFGRSQTILLISGIIFVTAGMFMRQYDGSDPREVGRKFVTFYKNLALLIFNTIILLVILEIMSGFILKGKIGFSTTPFKETVPRQVETWQADYDPEFNASNQTMYAPYVLWHNIPYQGKLIQVDTNGIRQTPGADCVEGAYRVFTFGGSAMWGHSSPDWGTIPAYLQAGLSEKMEQPVCVINYAQKGFVSTQELIELMLQLQQNHIPDLVIFYDGSNDLAATSQERATSIPHFSQTQTKIRLEHSFLGWVLKANLFKLANSFLPAPSNSDSLDEISNQALQNYLGVYQLVTVLANEYAFDYLFFTQPVIFSTHKALTPYEQTILQTSIADLGPSYEIFYPALQKQSQTLPNLFYLGEIFDETEDEIFVDYVHINPKGNQIVAEAILKAILAKFHDD